MPDTLSTLVADIRAYFVDNTDQEVTPDATADLLVRVAEYVSPDNQQLVDLVQATIYPNTGGEIDPNEVADLLIAIIGASTGSGGGTVIAKQRRVYFKVGSAPGEEPDVAVADKYIITLGQSDSGPSIYDLISMLDDVFDIPNATKDNVTVYRDGAWVEPLPSNYSQALNGTRIYIETSTFEDANVIAQNIAQALSVAQAIQDQNSEIAAAVGA